MGRERKPLNTGSVDGSGRRRAPVPHAMPPALVAALMLGAADYGPRPIRRASAPSRAEREAFERARARRKAQKAARRRNR